ncbi:MAG: undecaprenyl-diphosphate phosphatase [Candidatus Eisenbacteria bacterium]
MVVIDEMLKAAALGIVQALTEFLPVSSSGHMVIAKTLLGINEEHISIEVVTHFATALAVLIYLRHRVVEILRAVGTRLTVRREDMTEHQQKDFRLLLLVIVGTIPAAIVGLAARDHIGRFFEDVTTTSTMLIVTGVFVLVSGRLGRPGASLGLVRALIVGIGQAFAIIPGISRSGFTVGTGLLAGLERKEAFEFSLLLSLPAIIGASTIEVVSGRVGGEPAILLAAALPAFGGGYLAISLLFRAIVRNRFHMFAYYLIPLGIALLIFR